MNTTTLERTESAPRLQAFEQVDKANEDALWERREAYTWQLNKGCDGIRGMAADMLDLNDVSTILSVLAAKLYEAGFNEVADEIDVIAAEVEP